MPAPQNNFYARWREDWESRFLVLERTDAIPSERLLQAVWHHQRLLRDELKTSDGRTIRVLHPGFWNHEAGPDFRDAVLQFGEEPVVTGDVEIDMDASCWNQHRHAGNPAYAKVALHVLWSGVTSGARPVLTLEPVLDSPLAELRAWFQSDAAQGWPEALLGNCCAPLRKLTTEAAADLLNQAAEIRFHSKARAFEARARQCGWEQALWEGLFRGLGYKQNVWPFQCLAERLPSLATPGDSVLLIQARLFGAGGLLPDSLPAGATGYLQHLWEHWWRDRERLHDLALPPSIWHFAGLRPANLPQRRLALAAHWIADGSLMRKLEAWFTTESADATGMQTLLECLQPPQDEFWSRYWSFRSAPMPAPQPLLGLSRLTDLAINVVLPWFWMRANAGKNARLQTVAERRYFDWPKAQDNTVLKQARLRLFGKESVAWIKTAAAQQGLLQVVRDCCQHSNAICSQCPFPDLVRSWEVYQKNTVTG